MAREVDVALERANRHVGWTKSLVLALAVLFLFTGVALVVGLNNTRAVGSGQESGVQELGGGTGWASLLIAVGVVFLGWHRTGVPLFRLLGDYARWRVDVHNWVAIGALGFALFHTAELVALGDVRGWLSGSVATLLFFLLFVHGWWRAWWVDRFGRRAWRIVHWEMAAASIAFSLLHWALIEAHKEGWSFTF